MRLLLFGLLLATQLPATTYFVTVAGLGGEPDYEQRFTAWAKEIDLLVRQSPDVNVQTFSGAAATRANVLKALGEVAKSATAQDSLVVTLIGHGTFDGTDYKLAVPGPDLTAGDLGLALDRIAGKQLVINTSSASGASLPVLRKANRALITATRSGNEKNATNFARYWVQALRDPASDTDKNDVITALEAFRYAEFKTKEFYDQQKRLSTEHPVLDDSGAGKTPSTKPSAENGQGLLASRFVLLRMGSAQEAARNPEKQKLLARREELERQIEELQYKKAAMPNDEYGKELSGLLLDLAKVQAEIDK